MRACRCSKCKKEFWECDGIAAVHYSNPATVCPECELAANKDAYDKFNESLKNDPRKMEWGGL